MVFFVLEQKGFLYIEILIIAWGTGESPSGGGTACWFVGVWAYRGIISAIEEYMQLVRLIRKPAPITRIFRHI